MVHKQLDLKRRTSIMGSDVCLEKQYRLKRAIEEDEEDERKTHQVNSEYIMFLVLLFCHLNMLKIDMLAVMLD